MISGKICIGELSDSTSCDQNLINICTYVNHLNNENVRYLALSLANLGIKISKLYYLSRILLFI